MCPSYRVLAVLLGATGFVLAGYDAPVPAADPSVRLTGDVADTVRVFVVWGGSNACGAGTEALSVPPDSGVAYEWRWQWTHQAHPDPALRLDDPMPCGSLVEASEETEEDEESESKGSAWPRFSIVYDSLTAGAEVLFFTSVTYGGKLRGAGRG